MTPIESQEVILVSPDSPDSDLSAGRVRIALETLGLQGIEVQTWGTKQDAFFLPQLASNHMQILAVLRGSQAWTPYSSRLYTGLCDAGDEGQVQIEAYTNPYLFLCAKFGLPDSKIREVFRIPQG